MDTSKNKNRAKAAGSQIPITSKRVSDPASNSASIPPVLPTDPAGIHVLTFRGNPTDGAHVEAFRVHSITAIRSGQMSFSSSNSPGMETVENEKAAIDQAKVVMVAVSADYVASDQFEELVKYAADQGKRVIPLISQPKDLEGTLLEGLEPLPHSGKALSEMQPAEKARAFAGDSSHKGIASEVKGIASEVKAAVDLPLPASTQIPITSKRLSDQAGQSESIATVLPKGPGIHVLTLRGNSTDGEHVEAFRKQSCGMLRSARMLFSSSNSPGMESIEKEKRAIDQAKVVMVAVSANYVASDQFEELVKYAKAQGKHVIPFISQPTDLEGTLVEELQSLPRDGKALSEMEPAEQDSAFAGDRSSILSHVKAAAGIRKGLGVV